MPRPTDPTQTVIVQGSGRLRSPAPTLSALPGPKTLPLLGNVLDFKRLGGLHKAIEHWVDRYGPVFRLEMLGHPVVCVADTALIAEILRMRPEVFARGETLSSIINETGPVGLFTAEGEVWKRQRKLVMRALTPEQILKLREDHGIYMAGSGRINIAGLTMGNIDKFIADLATVTA